MNRKQKKYYTLTYSLNDLDSSLVPVDIIINQYPTLKANLMASSLFTIPVARLPEFFEFMEEQNYSLENHQIAHTFNEHFVYYFVYSYYDQ